MDDSTTSAILCLAVRLWCLVLAHALGMSEKATNNDLEPNPIRIMRLLIRIRISFLKNHDLQIRIEFIEIWSDPNRAHH